MSGSARRAGLGLLRRRIQRALGCCFEIEPDIELGTGAGRTFRRNIAVHQLREPPHDRQPQPGAAEFPCRGRIRLRERLEQFSALLLVHPDAGVFDDEHDAGAAPAERRRAGAHADAPALGELQRIAEQVEQDLPQPGRIADQRVVRSGLHGAGEEQAFRSRLPLEGREHAIDQAGQREWCCFQFQPSRLDLREVEHVVDDAQQRLRGVAHGRDGALLVRVEPLPVEHLHHAEHAVHRGADLVAHGGKERRLRLVGGLGLGALALGHFARHFLRVFALLQFRDVAEHAEQAAVGERTEGELDEVAALGLPLVARTAGREQHPHPFIDHLRDIVDRAKVAALDLEADDVANVSARLPDIRRHRNEPAVLRISETPAPVSVQQQDAVMHIFEHQPHVLARRLDLGAHRRDLLLARLLLGDVAGRARHAVGDAVAVALRDAALPRPAPRIVEPEVAVFDEQQGRQALEVIDNRFAIMLLIVRMNPRAGFLRRQILIRLHTENRAQQRRVVDGVADDVPVVDAVIDQLQGERKTLLVARRHGPRRSVARSVRWLRR